MGIDLNMARLLIRAHRSGVSFERMATLGRQGLYANRQGLISILRGSGYEITKDCIQRLLCPTTKYSEDFFTLLGAKEILAIDVSDYEGAQILHDMNRPIPNRLVSTFDLVLDSGTLEHIFELTTALRNATQMVRPNGRFISITMANNYCGHGFYQFSPELFYRFLCPRNGYSMESCIIWEDIPGSRFYQVPDPDSIRERVNLTSDFGAYMMVQANRQGDVSWEFVPLQSDYVRLWEGLAEVAQPPSRVPRFRPMLKAALKPILKPLRILRSAAFSYREQVWYQRRTIAAQDLRRRIKRSGGGILTPLKDLRVMVR
jgi:hypothetical protein